MQEPLFLDESPTLQFEKAAGMLTKLSDNIDTWPQEITQEIYKQLPFMSEYEANVILDKMDEERGFAFGSVEVRPRSAMTMEEQEVSSLDKVHVPVLVKESMLQPFDVFMVGKEFQPLSERRIREALFRPEIFDAARTRPYDPSLVHDLQPPIRAGYGGFGSGGVKLGSELKQIPLLPQLNGRVLQEHKEKLAADMREFMPSLAPMMYSNAGLEAAYESALGLEPIELSKTAEVVRRSIRPNVVQLTKLANGNVKVKWANTDMYYPEEDEVPPSMAEEMLGDQDLVAQMEADGTITASPDAAIKETMEAEETKVADSFGLWKVQESTGHTMIGWVFPNLLTLSMEPLPLSLFTNGSNYALQEHVAGELAGKSTDLPTGIPQGMGCLYFIDHGTAKAFVPMTITSTARGPDGSVRYMGSDELGEQVSFSFAEGLKTIQQIGEGEYVVPGQVKWMPLRGKTELVSAPLLFAKTAKRKFASRVEIIGDPMGLYSFRGPAVANIPEDETKFVKRAQAEFLGVALGMNPHFVKRALDEAKKGLEAQVVEGARPIATVQEKAASSRELVKKDLSELDRPIRAYFLAKEASILSDALTADKILGLGFLNVENVSVFVDMIPSLEDCASKIAELLFAVRIGLEEVPEVAVERMLKSLDDVIEGLKTLQQKELSYNQ